MKHLLLLFILLLCFNTSGTSQSMGKSRFAIGRVHYRGGGDWYGNKTSLRNMLKFFTTTTGLPTSDDEVEIKLNESFFFNYPLLYIAGHGNVSFTDHEAKNLRNYLINGGFLFADDDYGMDKYFRSSMKKVFPELEFIEIPFTDQLFKKPFLFNSGAPKIHEHDGGPAKVFGLYYNSRLICIYTFNTDISDGCEDEGIHDDSSETKLQALRFSANIIMRILTAN